MHEELLVLWFISCNWIRMNAFLKVRLEQGICAVLPKFRFFRLLLWTGDPKKVESEMQGAIGGREDDQVLLAEGEDGKCLRDYNS